MIERHFKIKDETHEARLHNTYKRSSDLSEHQAQRDLITLACVLNLPKDHVFTHLHNAERLGVMLFTRPFSETSYANPETWSVVMKLAVVLRNHDDMAYLKTMTLQEVNRENMFIRKMDPVLFEIHRTLDSSKELKAAIRRYQSGGDPDLSDLRNNFITHLTDPFIEVLESVCDRNEDSFNQSLEMALRSHYDFYNVDGRPGFGSPADRYSWISFNLLAACSLAHDSGMAIKVESEYIPRWLYEGDFSDCKLISNDTFPKKL